MFNAQSGIISMSSQVSSQFPEESHRGKENAD